MKGERRLDLRADRSVPNLITERARAKVNLTLEVLGRRPDGHHELNSLVAFADFGDTLTLRPAHQWRLTTTGPMSGAIIGGNIVDRAAAGVAAAWPMAATGEAHLEKLLPVFAGIGGGSADAAAALRALRRLNAGIPGEADVNWTALARRLGADVPVCLASSLSRMQGIGERVQMFSTRHTLAAVLVNPGVAVSTAAVFAELAAPALGNVQLNQPFHEPATTVDLLALVSASSNDLETPAIRVVPAIGEVLGRLAATRDCQLARMSGSGPTCFGLYETEAAAEAAAREIAEVSPDWWVRATLFS